MIKYRIKFAQRSREDIVAIGDYIAYTLQELDISQAFVRGLKDSILQLSFFPYKFSIVQNHMLRSKGIRYLPYKNYYVFYEVIEESKCVIVLRILYKRRNWKDILN